MDNLPIQFKVITTTVLEVNLGCLPLSFRDSIWEFAECTHDYDNPWNVMETSVLGEMINKDDLWTHDGDVELRAYLKNIYEKASSTSATSIIFLMSEEDFST